MHRNNARCLFSRNATLLGSALAATLIAATPAPLCAEPIVPVSPPALFDDSKSGELTARYRPNQIAPPVPKYEYTDAGQVILVKRYPITPVSDPTGFIKFKYVENKNGVEHFERCVKLKRDPVDILSQQQQAALTAWGQPDYLRGPYRTTRGEYVIEWAYHPLNRLFQWIDGKLVYQGPLTDQERTVLVHGAPTEAIIGQLQPNIRRETWIYRPRSFCPSPFSYTREKVFSFANGETVYSQETP